MRFSWLLVALLPTGSLGGQCPTQPQEHDDAAWQCGLTEDKRLSQQLHGDGYSAVTYSELWSGQHCGFCGGPANDTLTRLVDSLRKKERECRKMVVVSAAFGKKYLWRFAYKHSRAQTLRRHFGDCFIRFVAKDELESFVMNRKSTVEVEVFGEHAQHFKDAIAERKAAGLHPHAWPDSLNILVPINMTELPFAAPRRNGKIFKIISHRLFPWAERILWIDAKLMLSETLTPMEYFDLTIHNTGACAAFMNLPGREGGDVAGQIKRIEAAAHKRAVTDNLDVAFQQVEAYQKEDGEAVGKNIMIDGALIATYFGSERCRHFNALFGCAWFNEIQCYSDRDQLSFAYTLTRALGITPNDTVPLTTKSPPTVEDKTGTPTVLIVPSFGKSSQKDLLFQGLTHWYYSSRAAIYGTRPGHTFD